MTDQCIILSDMEKKTKPPDSFQKIPEYLLSGGQVGRNQRFNVWHSHVERMRKMAEKR
jgi:hypothetical protein